MQERCECKGNFRQGRMEIQHESYFSSVQLLCHVRLFATPGLQCKRAIQLALIGGSEKTSSQPASGRCSGILDAVECIERSILCIGESLILSVSNIKHIMNQKHSQLQEKKGYSVQRMGAVRIEIKQSIQLLPLNSLVFSYYFNAHYLLSLNSCFHLKSEVK